LNKRDFGVKVTNISTSTLYLDDLRITHASQVEARKGEDRYLGPGQGIYLPNTSEVLRSAYKGDLRKWRELGVVELEDTDTLNAGASVVLLHNFGFAPVVYVLKQVGSTWVDATGTVDVVHNQAFTQTTVTNTLGVTQTLYTRLV
jgi:hypothetical protein